MDSFRIIDDLREKNRQLQNENDEYRKSIENLERGDTSSMSTTTSTTSKHNSNNIKLTFQQMAENDSEVKRRTGFQSLNHMLAFVIIVCNGDHDVMIYKKTKLTWLEEWFFALEYLWGRTITRWWDAEAEMEIHRSSTQTIFHDKLERIKACRESWPRYASYSEDFALMKEKWKDKYKGKRVVMWDDTNVNLAYKPSGADEQRLTFSVYYSSNCCKGGVFLQFCGWNGVEHLWVGATSDSHYQEHTEIFEKKYICNEQFG